MFKDTFSELSSAFTRAINSVQDEGGAGGLGSKAQVLIQKLESMRDEIDGWRSGRGLLEADAVGERSDAVDRSASGGGGLYKE